MRTSLLLLLFFFSSCPQMESQLCSLRFDLWITVWEEAWWYCIFIYSQCWSLNIPLILLNSPKLALLFFIEPLHLWSSVVRDPLGEAVGCHERYLRLTPAWPVGEVTDDIKGVDMAEVVINNHKIALCSDMPRAKDRFDCIMRLPICLGVSITTQPQTHITAQHSELLSLLKLQNSYHDQPLIHLWGD